MRHADGHLVTDEEIADIYLRAYEVGEKAGCLPTFEVHVNMWSEHFGRVAKVSEKVETRGVPFRMPPHHSHVIFKIDNPEEPEILGMRADVDSGAVRPDDRQSVVSGKEVPDREDIVSGR